MPTTPAAIRSLPKRRIGTTLKQWTIIDKFHARAFSTDNSD
jgi:hypothetical protein